MPSSGGSISDAPVNKVVDGQEHQLSYITPGEAQNLVSQGGQPTMTNEGVMAYPPQGIGKSNNSSSSSGGGPAGGASAGGNYGGDSSGGYSDSERGQQQASNQGPAGGASAGGDYGGNVNPQQEYAGRTIQEQRDYRADPKDFIEKQNQVEQDLTFKEH